MEGYFLIVWDIIQFCKSRRILVQGRGSAANSAVCYALGITACDPLKLRPALRAISHRRNGASGRTSTSICPPGDRREEVIQYCYRKYGRAGLRLGRQRHHLPDAQRDPRRGQGARIWAGVARQAGRPLGRHGRRRPRRLSRRAPVCGPRSRRRARAAPPAPGRGDSRTCPGTWGSTRAAWSWQPARLDEVVPIQPATMQARTVIQWDKDDCADLRLLKIDLLGLGMLAALEEAQTLCPAHDGVPFDLAECAAGRRGGVRDAPEGRHHWRVPGGVAGPDGDPAAPAPSVLLRRGGGGGPHPPRPHRGPARPSLPAKAHRARRR